MSQTDRLRMIARPHAQFSIIEQCALLKVPRSTLYYKPEPVSDGELKLMRRIDEIFTKWPFYGSRRLVEELHGEGYIVNRERVRRAIGRGVAWRGVHCEPRACAAFDEADGDRGDLPKAEHEPQTPTP